MLIRSALRKMPFRLLSDKAGMRIQGSLADIVAERTGGRESEPPSGSAGGWLSGRLAQRAAGNPSGNSATVRQEPRRSEPCISQAEVIRAMKGRSGSIARAAASSTPIG